MAPTLGNPMGSLVGSSGQNPVQGSLGAQNTASQIMRQQQAAYNAASQVMQQQAASNAAQAQMMNSMVPSWDGRYHFQVEPVEDGFVLTFATRPGEIARKYIAEDLEAVLRKAIAAIAADKMSK